MSIVQRSYQLIDVLLSKPVEPSAVHFVSTPVCTASRPAPFINAG